MQEAQNSAFNSCALNSAASIRSETKRATHDGYIWPFDRNRMSSSSAILVRMGEDLAHLIREAGAFETVCDDALIALGWTPEQVRRYGEQAARQARGENACGNDNHARERAHEAA